VRAATGFVAAGIFVVALAPRPGAAAACDDWLRQTRSFTGSYVTAGEPYARTFVFAMLVACKGKTEVVTVQSPTRRLPLCAEGQGVELTGTLVWNKSLVDGHYEINDPSGVTCVGVPPTPTTKTAETRTAPAPPAAEPRAAVPSAPAAPEPRAAVSSAPEPRVAATPPASGSGVWTGRYQDSRGAGDVTFTLVRGTSTVSGTWKMRTGGGGPVTGLVESGGTRIQLRMENLAPDCPGTFEGVGEITAMTLAATYRGRDCEGAVSDGRLELRLQAAGR
jgi:hypothetical protein